MVQDLKINIIKMAKYYIHAKKASIRSTAEKFGVAYSTANKYLNHSLKGIDINLWVKVQAKKAANIAKSRQNFVKPVKKCFLSSIFKN